MKNCVGKVTLEVLGEYKYLTLVFLCDDKKIGRIPLIYVCSRKDNYSEKSMMKYVI